MTELDQRTSSAATEIAHPLPRVVEDRDDRGYADIQSYAALGDGRTVALVARDGRIDWLPLPDLNSVPPFAALLDATDGGFIELQPTSPYRVTRSYLTSTAVLETTFHTDEGVARVTDALNTGLAGRLPWCELARRIEGLSGSVTLRGVVAPGTLLNTASPWISDTVHGTVLRVDGVTMAVRTLNDSTVEVAPRQIVVHYRTTAGSRHLLGLVSTDREPLRVPDPENLDDGVDLTIENWQKWSASIRYDGPWADTVARSAIALKVLIYAPTGAVAAAATTSLPESLTAQKNWDYRFSWIRDTAFSLAALLQLGVREETHGAISWMLRVLRAHGQKVSVLQTLDGHLPGGEVTQFDVEGWRGHGPVVGGNRASGQLQLGVYGDLFNIVQLYVDDGNVLDDGTARLMSTVADQAADYWRRADAGIWELEETRHYTTSKLGCWQALTKAVHLGEIGQIPGPVRSMALRGGGHHALDRGELLVRGPRRVRILSGQWETRRLDPAARDQWLRSRRPDAAHHRCADQTPRAWAAPVSLQRRIRGGGHVRGVLVLAGRRTGAHRSDEPCRHPDGRARRHAQRRGAGVGDDRPGRRRLPRQLPTGPQPSGDHQRRTHHRRGPEVWVVSVGELRVWHRPMMDRWRAVERGDRRRFRRRRVRARRRPGKGSARPRDGR